MSKTDSSSPGPRQELEHYYDCHNGCCLVYIGNTSNLDRNHIGGHCTYIYYLYHIKMSGFLVRYCISVCIY